MPGMSSECQGPELGERTGLQASQETTMAQGRNQAEGERFHEQREQPGQRP